MKFLRVWQTPRGRALMAAASGWLLAAAFPWPGIAGLAWVAPGLMLYSARGEPPGRAFGLGYLAGLTHFLISLYWLLLMSAPAGAVAGWLALSAYLALYPAVWVWLSWGLFNALSGRWQSVRPVSEGSPASAVASEPLRWVSRFVWLHVCAALWVGLEMVRGVFLTGFPWNFVGVSQYKVLPLIQVASVTGVYGVSFLVIWFSVAGATTLSLAIRGRGAGLVWRGDLAIPLIAVIAVAIFGMRRIQAAPEPAREIMLALIQPSIPQRMIWDPGETTNRFEKLLELSESALEVPADVLIWPEASLPGIDEAGYRRILELVRRRQVWMIFGADDADVTRQGSGWVTNFYNAAFLLDPKGAIRASYRKQRLVIFGEYVPLADQLPFVRYLTPIGDSFAAGDRPVPFRLDGITTSVLICFEDTFPGLARAAVDDETDFLLNLTNDGWFGRSAAQWQHAAIAVFRAVENGVPLVRCTNNGLTCWVDPYGRMRAVFFPGTADVYQAGIKRVSVPVGSNAVGRAGTWYRRRGDWFGWGCAGVALVCAGVVFVVERREGRARRGAGMKG